jgi:hypothetical protein
MVVGRRFVDRAAAEGEHARLRRRATHLAAVVQKEALRATAL